MAATIVGILSNTKNGTTIQKLTKCFYYRNIISTY